MTTEFSYGKNQLNFTTQLNSQTKRNPTEFYNLSQINSLSGTRSIYIYVRTQIFKSHLYDMGSPKTTILGSLSFGGQ